MGDEMSYKSITENERENMGSLSWVPCSCLIFFQALPPHFEEIKVHKRNSECNCCEHIVLSLYYKMLIVLPACLHALPKGNHHTLNLCYLSSQILCHMASLLPPLLISLEIIQSLWSSSTAESKGKVSQDKQIISFRRMNQEAEEVES